MSRRARIDIANHFYHVIARGQRKNPLFFSDKDKEYFLTLLHAILKEFDIILYAYCIMRNHYHLLIYRGLDSLGRIMKKLNTQYALYFNKKYGTVGHVFQGRYKSFIVLNENYLIHLVKYIHNNPVKANIVKKSSDYKFSSASFYEGQKCFLPIKKIPAFASNNGIIRYKNFMLEEEINIKYFKDSIGNKEEYLTLKKRKEGRYFSNYHQRRANEKDIVKDAKQICIELNMSYNKLIKSKYKRNYEDKKIFIKKLLDLGYSQAEIARLLKITRSAISQLLNYET